MINTKALVWVVTSVQDNCQAQGVALASDNKDGDSFDFSLEKNLDRKILNCP